MAVVEVTAPNAERDLTDFRHDGFPVHVVVDRDPGGVNPDLSIQVFTDSGEANAERDYLSYTKNRVVSHEIVNLTFCDLFPDSNLFTLFDGKTHLCSGLYRTEEDAIADNKKIHGEDWRQYAVIQIDFTD